MSDQLIYTYLDTSALLLRAEAAAASPPERVKQIGAVLDGLFKDPSRRFACSEVTLLEFHSVLTAALRSPDASKDLAWWDESVALVMNDLQLGKIIVVSPPSKAAEHVMSLVTIATGRLRRSLKAWDAMHAVVAARWAEDIGSAVKILTADGDFDVAIEIMSASGHIEVENLDVLASTGQGVDKANRGS